MRYCLFQSQASLQVRSRERETAAVICRREFWKSNLKTVLYIKYGFRDLSLKTLWQLNLPSKRYQENQWTATVTSRRL